MAAKKIASFRCHRRTCISATKVTFGAVTADRWAVAVSSLACRVAKHVRHYPTARADSDEVAVPRALANAKCVPREAAYVGSVCRAFCFLPV